MLQLQRGAGKPLLGEGNLKELKTTHTHSACAKRTLRKYLNCDLKPYLDSKSATTFKNWGEESKYMYVAED